MLNRLTLKRYTWNEAILQFIKQNQDISHSSVFKGTLYEHTVMRELNEKLAMKELQKVGGANDRGVDIKGQWPLDIIFRKTVPIVHLEQNAIPTRCTIHGTSLKPLSKKLQENGGKLDPIKVLVQCKAFSFSKVSPRELRELLGTFASVVPDTQRKRTIIMMCSPNLLTKEGLSLVNALRVPLIYLRIEMLRQSGGAYDLCNSGRLLNYYENDYAAALLQGCGIKEWLKLSLYKNRT
ncbi:RRG7 (YOR305W) [Zygosaccharomyces parabailii]|nr:RRG7 (YOR305W) [Zygosaccharomyces parabailii]